MGIRITCSPKSGYRRCRREIEIGVFYCPLTLLERRSRQNRTNMFRCKSIS